MMPDSPDSSVLGTPQTTRSGRRTKAPAAFGNVVTSDYVYASDDEDEEGLPVQEDDESPEWGGEKHRIEVDSGDDEEEADESGGDGSDDEEEGGGKSKAAKGKKGKKEPTKVSPQKPAVSAYACRYVNAPRGLTLPAVQEAFCGCECEEEGA